MRKIWLATLVILLTVLGAVPGSGVAAAAEKQVLRIGMDELPVLLDPASIEGLDRDKTTVIKALYEGLVRLDKNGKPVPGVAQSWTMGADGKTYTFKLRSNAKWSNGKKVTAADFVFAWKQALTPGLKKGNVFRMYYVAGAESYHTGKLKDFAKVGVKAINDSTLQVTLKGKYAYFPSLLAEPVYFPVSQEAKEAAGITNGPFQLQSRSITEIKLVKNPYYYDASSIRLSEVNLLSPLGHKWKNSTEAYVNGQVDWVGGGNTPVDFAYEAQIKEDDYTYAPSASTYYYQFNLEEKPFSNINIRKALAMAIDQDEMPMPIPAYGFVPWTLFGSKAQYRAEVSDTAFDRSNVNKAKELLAKGLKQEGLTALPPFSINVNEGEAHAAVATMVAEQWKEKLGVTATTDLQRWENYLANRLSGSYQVTRAGWSADFNDPATFLNFFRSDSTDNDSGWSNKTYDQLVKQAEQTFDAAKRVQLYAKAEQLLMKETVIIPVYNYVADILRNPGIAGVYIDYDGSIAFSRWYWK